jgi:hypothetical protein
VIFVTKPRALSVKRKRPLIRKERLKKIAEEVQAEAIDIENDVA